MKTLVTPVTAGQRQWVLVMFDFIQTAFNAHPGTLIRFLKGKATSGSALSLIPGIQALTMRLIDECWTDVVTLVEGQVLVQKVSPSKAERELEELFSLNAARIAPALKVKGEKEGFDPANAARFYQAVSKEVFVWLFTECDRILREVDGPENK